MSTRRAAAALAILILALTGLSAQIPGRNINMVTGTTFPGGDPWLQKQNEPSIAVSTRNPCTLLGGANDYRAVNIPGDFADGEIGDAWLGLYKSTDCGQTWFSTLVPGYPQDQSKEGLASPVKGLSAGADPTIRSGPAGMFFYSFIAFNRGSNVGKYAVARLIDNNNREGGDPIKYLGTTLIDSGSAGQFLDKPYIAVTAGTGTCTVDGQTVQASVVHMAWTVFVGNSDQTVRTKVYYARSSNCGASVDFPPTKLSEGFPVNQGASIAVSPVDGSVLVAWRQFAADRSTDAILFARSTDGGRTFTRAASIPALEGFLPFDQATTSKSFRTNAFPTMTADHTGRVHLAISVRRAALDQARVMHLSTTDGVSWTMPRPVDEGHTVGHQVMPALTYAGGRLQMVWYDLKDSEAGKAYPSAFEAFIREIFPVRHTLDVRGAIGIPQSSGVVSFTPYEILQLDGPPPAREVSQYLVGNYTGADGTPVGPVQVQFNRPNLKLYAGGSRPFMGDYIDMAGLSFVPVRSGTGQQWVLNDGTSAAKSSRVFHAVWTDNRDARVGTAQPEPVSDTAATTPLGYAAPATPACDGNPNALPTSRNANVYTSRITPGVFLAIPGNAKPTTCSDKVNCGPNPGIQRAFAVYVQNTTGQLRTFRLKIENQPVQGIASFDQLAAAPLVTIDLTIGPRSSAARTVYVTSAQKYPDILVTVLEINVPAGQVPLTGSTIVNPDIQNPDIQNPDIQNPDIQNNEIHNPDIQNPDIQNPDIQNPDIQNPDIQNPDIQNPDIQNPDIQNPDIQNPDIQNPDIQNPDIQNPDIQNGSLTDVSVEVTNNGNTTSSYQVGVDIAGSTDPFLFQLVGRRVYRTPTARGCQLVEAGTNQILFNIPNPVIDGTLFEPNSSDVRNATVLLEPGETIKLTLRAWDKDVLTSPNAPPNDNIQPFCPMLGDLCTTVTHNVNFIVEAQAYDSIDGEVVVPDTGRPSDSVSTTPLTILTASVPGGATGNVYGPVTLLTDAATRFSWSITSGSLPPGLALDPGTGTIDGIPKTEGTFNFTATVVDGAGRTASRAYTLQTMTFAGGDLVVADGSPTAPSSSIFRVNSSDGTTTLVASIAGHATAVAIDSQRRIIVADSVNDAILRVTPGHVETLFSGAPLGNPDALVLATDGDVIVGDNGADAIYRIDLGNPDGPSASLVLDLPDSPGITQNIRMAFEAAGALIVGNDSDDGVTLWRVPLAAPAAPAPFTAQGVSHLGGLEVVGETILIADYGNNTIARLAPDGSSTGNNVPVPDIGQNMSGFVVVSTAPDVYIVTVTGETGAGMGVKRINEGVEGAPHTITVIKGDGPLTYPAAVAIVRFIIL